MDTEINGAIISSNSKSYVPMPQYLNALMIDANQVIADSGVTSIFIMEGARGQQMRRNLTSHDQFARWLIHACV